MQSSRQRDFEHALVNVFTGKTSASSILPGVAGGSSGNPVLNLLGGFIERSIGAAFERHSTRTFETERSQEAAQLRFSRGQTETALAEMVARARRNS